MFLKAISEADREVAKVVSLGVLNQDLIEPELMEAGHLYLQKYEKLGVKLVDGTSLALVSSCCGSYQ